MVAGERTEAPSPGYRHVESLLAAEPLRDARRGRRDRGPAPLGAEAPTRSCGARARCTGRPRPCSTCTAGTSQRAATSSRRHLVDPLCARAEERARLSQGDPAAGWTSPGSASGSPAGPRRGRRASRTAPWRSRSPRRSGSARAAPDDRAAARMFADEPPDMLLLETLTLIRDPATYQMVERLLETGLPRVALVRRCRHGVCGVYGQHWGPPEGDLFGRAARRFEEMGVEALLINCLPVDHVPGMVSWLRDFTELRSGSTRTSATWPASAGASTRTIGPEAYARARARMARRGRADRRRLLRRDLRPHRGPRAGAGRDEARPPPPAHRGSAASGPPTAAHDARAVERQGRHGPLPLPLPELAIEEGVFVPTQGSFLVWRHLFRAGAGKGKRCLDVGCGCGILAVQLALNGAEHVHAIDIDRSAVANTSATPTATASAIASAATRRPLPLDARRDATT